MYSVRIGFTLSEILITLVIIGFIGALGVPMLGQEKSKKPLEVQSMHGTIECFWENDRLMQFSANNTENREGELLDVTNEGACYFTAPTANLFVLQAIGAGGIGAYGLSGMPHYKPTKEKIRGYIPTDTGFLSTISNTKLTPDWVRKEWDLQWKNGSGVSYTLTSPVGAGGNGACEKRRSDVTNGEYNDCSERCTTGLERLCPNRCTFELKASGGNSGRGAQYIVKAPLLYSPNGQQDDVKYTYDYSETRLEIGSKIIILPASKSGSNGKINYPKEGEYENGKNADDFNLMGDAKNAGFTIIRKSLLNNANKGGSGCNNASGESAKRGSIENNDPANIEYYTESLAIEAYFGVAGSAGDSEMRLLEKLPVDTQFKLVPASKNSGDNNIAYSTIYKKNKITDDWEIFMRVSSGSNGWSGTEILPIEEGDLPFPKAYYPKAFTPSIPTISVASSGSYKSYLAQYNNSVHMPGASGAGAHPIILSVSGMAEHMINGVLTGNEELKPIVSTDVRCYSNSTLEGQTQAYTYCGAGNSSGNPGAVIISW